MMQQGQPMPQQVQPPASSPMQGGLDMNQYLMQKVQDIKKRMGQDDMGALSNVTAAMPKPRMQGV